MNMSDPIADMLTRVRNAYMARLETVDMPLSKMKQEIARILKREGYIRDFATEALDDHRKTLRVYLKYSADHEPVVTGIRRVSRPSLRRYVSSDEVPRVLNGLGVAILSTSSGIMTGREARRQHVGGEVLCYVW